MAYLDAQVQVCDKATIVATVEFDGSLVKPFATEHSLVLDDEGQLQVLGDAEPLPVLGDA